MRKRVAKVVGIVLLVFLILGAYRSFIDHRPYPESFDNVVMTALADSWQLLTSPIVLTALVILLGSYLGRAPLLAMASAIEEIKAGPWSAKFNQGALAEILTRWVRPSSPTTRVGERPGVEEAALSQQVRDAISRMDPKLCQFLIRVAGKPMSFDELMHSLDEELELYPRGSGPMEKSMRYFNTVGFFSATASLLMGLVFAIDRPANDPGAHLIIAISPAVADLLEWRAKEGQTST